MTDVLREILAEVRAIRAAVEARRPAEDAATANALRQIHARTGDRVFTAGDLAEHSQLPTAAPLRAALQSVVRTVNARSLGRFLRRAEGSNQHGLIVRRVGTDRDGVLWKIEAHAVSASFETAFTVAGGSRDRA